MIAEVVHRLLWSVWFVALQLNGRANARLTLIDESCPAGFEIVEGIIPKRYSCQCSKVDLNIQSCNETTEDVLLKVRVLCVWCGVLGVQHLFCRTLHCHFISSISFSLMFPTTLTLMCPPLPCLMQAWLWGTPITNSDGTKDLFATSCSRGYCHCQPWHTDNRAECRFTVSQDLAQRDQQCTCNRKGKIK